MAARRNTLSPSLSLVFSLPLNLAHSRALTHLHTYSRTALLRCSHPCGCRGLVLCSLMFAAAGGQLKIVQMLIDAKCDLDQATEFDDADADIGGETALHLAAYHGHTDILATLLRHGAEPNMSMRNGRTALIIACEQGRGDVAYALLDHGCNVHAVTNSGKSALYSACENGHAHLVPMLLDHGSDVNQVR